MWMIAFQELMFQNYSLSYNSPNSILFSPLTGNDLEALQVHLCILASDFTIEGQPSLEAPLINVTSKEWNIHTIKSNILNYLIHKIIKSYEKNKE